MIGTGCRNLNLALALSRREVIRAGGLGLLGLSLPRFLEARAINQNAGRQSRPVARPAASFGKAKSCILLFMWGGPAQQETWDMKPDAPEEVRGEFRPIATNIPGVNISEHFPLLARQARSPGDHPLGASRRREPHDRHARAVDRPADPAARRR